MHERLEKAKQHVKDQKNKYLVASGVVVGGTIVYFAVKKNIVIDKAPIDVSLTVGDITGDVNSPLIEIVKNYAQRGGHPGKKIYIPELGMTCRSIRQAATMTGVERNLIAECVKGIRDTANNLHFYNLGDADPPA